MQRRFFMTGLGVHLLGLPPAAEATPVPIMTAWGRDILARTVLGEAEGEPVAGQIAVAQVVFNRVRSSSGLFAQDTSVPLACLRRGQFMCWHNSRLHSRTLTADILNAVQIAETDYAEGHDLSRGATHFLRVGEHAPWSRQARVTARIGRHVFMKIKEA